MQNSFKVLVIVLMFSLFACSTPPTAEPPTPTIAVVTRTRTPGAAIVSPSPLPSATILRTAAPNLATTLTPTAPTTPTFTPAPTASPTPSVTPTMLGGCAEIWQAGFYKMYADFKTTIKRYDCMIVQASDVVIDCDNHTIEGMDKQGHGFWIRKYGFPLLQAPNNVEIRNCKVTNARDGVFAEAGTNLYIHDNDFSNNLDDTNKDRYGIFLGMTEGGGIRLDNVVGARVERNVVNNSAIGIDVRNSESVVVRNNTAVNNSAWGINLLNTQASEVSANTLRDNVRWCTWGSGVVDRGCDAGGIILQDGSSRNVVKENILSGQNGGGIFVKAHNTRCGDDNVIQGNKISEALYNGIELGFCKGNKVIGNEIVGNESTYVGISFGFDSNTEIRNNVIRNMRNQGISSWNSRGVIVDGNQITNSNEGVYFYWDKWDTRQFGFLAPSPDSYASRDNTITNNTLRDNRSAGVRLSNSIQNRVQSNTFASNGKNVVVEGKNDGNVIVGQ